MQSGDVVLVLRIRFGGFYHLKADLPQIAVLHQPPDHLANLDYHMDTLNKYQLETFTNTLEKYILENLHNGQIIKQCEIYILDTSAAPDKSDN